MKYNNIIEVVKGEFVPEDSSELIRKLKTARKRGYLTRNEFLEVCTWKSPRARKHYENNNEKQVRSITKEAFSIIHEKTKINRLTELKGVSLPLASAILTMAYPEKYGVIDIRAWKVLYKFGEVKDNPSGKNFTPEQWYKYLVKLRHIAKKLRKTPRNVDLTLFHYHKNHIQRGNLYK